MAAVSNTIKLYDVDGKLYWDEECVHPVSQNMYRAEESDDLFLDEDLTISTERISLPKSKKSNEIKPNKTPSSQTTPPSQTTSSSSSTNESQTVSISHSHTLFLIETMRHYIEEDDDPPRDFRELQLRIDRGRGKKKLMWQTIADKMESEFTLTFDSKKITRKWQTLVDGYKKAKDNDGQTGKAPSRFKYFQEMDSLLKDRHDVNVPVTATAEGVVVNRPSEISCEHPKTNSGSRKRKSDNENLLEYLRESDQAAADRQNKLIDQLQENQKAMAEMFSALARK